MKKKEKEKKMQPPQPLSYTIFTTLSGPDIFSQSGHSERGKNGVHIGNGGRRLVKPAADTSIDTSTHRTFKQDDFTFLTL